MKSRSWRFVFVLSWLIYFPAQAGLFYVNLNNTNPVAPYASWATAATNLQGDNTARFEPVAR